MHSFDGHKMVTGFPALDGFEGTGRTNWTVGPHETARFGRARTARTVRAGLTPLSFRRQDPQYWVGRPASVRECPLVFTGVRECPYVRKHSDECHTLGCVINLGTRTPSTARDQPARSKGVNMRCPRDAATSNISAPRCQARWVRGGQRGTSVWREACRVISFHPVLMLRRGHTPNPLSR